MSPREIAHALLLVAGVSQLALCAGSLAIPRVLRWREELAPWKPLMRQMFWTYAVYIWVTNLAFALISLRPDLLLDGTPLAACVCGFAFAYWLGRVVIQWTVFDLGDLPRGRLHTLARWVLELLFVCLTGVYGLALAINLGWL